jgi:hypothetical protein
MSVYWAPNCHVIGVQYIILKLDFDSTVSIKATPCHANNTA